MGMLWSKTTPTNLGRHPSECLPLRTAGATAATAAAKAVSAAPIKPNRFICKRPSTIQHTQSHSLYTPPFERGELSQPQCCERTLQNTHAQQQQHSCCSLKSSSFMRASTHRLFLSRSSLVPAASCGWARPRGQHQRAQTTRMTATTTDAGPAPQQQHQGPTDDHCHQRLSVAPM